MSKILLVLLLFCLRAQYWALVDCLLDFGILSMVILANVHYHRVFVVFEAGCVGSFRFLGLWKSDLQVEILMCVWKLCAVSCIALTSSYRCCSLTEVVDLIIWEFKIELPLWKGEVQLVVDLVRTICSKIW